MDSWVWNKNND